MKIIIASPAHKKRVLDFIDKLPYEQRWIVEVTRDDDRTLDQNAKLWPMLSDVSTQILWHGLKLSTDDWKQMFTASLRKYQVVPNIEGTGFVVLGMSTSRMKKAMFCDLIELIYAFGSEREVKWSEKASKHYEEFGHG